MVWAARDAGPRGPRAPRRGFAYLDVQVAFATLGVVLAGLAPVVVAQLRLMRQIEVNFDKGYLPGAPLKTCFLVPPADPWANKYDRKLGAGAALLDALPPVNQELVNQELVNQVKITQVTGAGPSDTMSADATVTAISPPP